jgi:hypothetical protein
MALFDGVWFYDAESAFDGHGLLVPL